MPPADNEGDGDSSTGAGELQPPASLSSVPSSSECPKLALAGIMDRMMVLGPKSEKQGAGKDERNNGGAEASDSSEDESESDDDDEDGKKKGKRNGKAKDGKGKKKKPRKPKVLTEEDCVGLSYLFNSCSLPLSAEGKGKKGVESKARQTHQGVDAL